MKTIIEIRPAEGGNDAKLLAEDMLNIYRKACNINKISVAGVQWLEGCIILTADSKTAYQFFSQESGVHRWIRVPPTEKKGRTQTSVVTVAVLKESEKKSVEFKKDDVEKWYTRGTGNGGQNRNKVETVVCLKHIPTGILVKCQEHRTQKQNEDRAWEILIAKLEKINNTQFNDKVSEERQSQFGSGERSEKRRTYRCKEDIVIDHVNNKQTTLKEIYKGKINLLHP